MQGEEMNIAAAIAQFCVKPVASNMARRLACAAITDTLACMVAGRDDQATTIVKTAFAGFSDGGKAALITGGTASPMLAALINGTAAHALDYDDNFLPGMSHASAVLVPAILAVTDFETVTGAQLIDAYLAGLQAQAFVGSGVGQAHYTAGWHGTSTIGSIGSAVAVARLLELDADLTAEAIRIAVSYACGTKGQFGTLIKPVHAGMAARNAVEAALLAKAGLQARSDILEGEQGFHELFAGDKRLVWKSTDIRNNPTHIIETAGVMPKRHPCCGSTHLVIDGLLDLMVSHGFHADDVAGIDTRVGIANYRNLAYPQPENEMQARFSMQYCVARALRQRQLSLADFTPATVQHHARDPLLARITMTAYTPEEEQNSPDKLPHIVNVKLHDGRILSAARHYAVGALQEPFSDHDSEQKFMDCCRNIAQATMLYKQLQSLEQAQNLRMLEPLFQ